MKYETDVQRVFEKENRKIFSSWRLLYKIRKVFSTHYPESSFNESLLKLKVAGILASPKVDDGETLANICFPNGPYTNIENDAIEVCGEAFFNGIFSYQTALHLHSFNESLGCDIHLFVPKMKNGVCLNEIHVDKEVKAWLPLDIESDYWNENTLPKLHPFKEFKNNKINTHRIKPEFIFGVLQMTHKGVAIRVTDKERTLLDCLRYPKHSGGLNNVLTCFKRALDEGLQLNKIFEYCDIYKQSILYQRVGFLLETFGIQSSILEDWKRNYAIQGGSRKLCAENKFTSENFSEEWKLSINFDVENLDPRK